MEAGLNAGAGNSQPVVLCTRIMMTVSLGRDGAGPPTILCLGAHPMTSRLDAADHSAFDRTVSECAIHWVVF